MALAEFLLIPDYSYHAKDVMNNPSAMEIWKYLAKHYKILYNFLLPVHLVQQEVLTLFDTMESQACKYSQLTKLLTQLREYFNIVDRQESYISWWKKVCCSSAGFLTTQGKECEQ